MRWLRDKALAGWEESDVSGHSSWKYLLVGLLIVAGVFAYLERAPQPRDILIANQATATPSAAAATITQAQAPLNPDTKAIAPQAGAPATEIPAVQGRQLESINAAALKTGVAPEARNLAADTHPAHDSIRQADQDSFRQADDDSAQNMLVAERYLEGKTTPRNTSEAAKYLWKAVARQNAGAALLLADLYMRGDGVSKNCDQARLLLVAAAKKGTPQAADRLRSLERSGCQ